MPRSRGRVPLRRGRSPDALRARTALRRAARRVAAGAGRGGAVSQRRRLCGRSQSLCRRRTRPTRRPAVGHEVHRAAAQHARKTVTVLTQGSARGQERDLAEGRRAHHGGHHARHRRGRQRVRRPLLHPRLRRAQRHVHRRHPRSGRQHPRKLLHRADRDPARAGIVLRRSRHRRRRHQHRHQAGDRPATSPRPRPRSAPTPPSASRSTSTR